MILLYVFAFILMFALIAIILSAITISSEKGYDMTMQELEHSAPINNRKRKNNSKEV